MSSSALIKTCLRDCPVIGSSSVNSVTNSFKCLLLRQQPSAHAALLVQTRSKYLTWDDPWDRLNRRKIKKKVFHNVIRDVDPRVSLGDTRAVIPADAMVDNKISMQYLARCSLQKSSALVDVGSIYKKKEHKFSSKLYQPEYLDSPHNPKSFHHTELTNQTETKPKYLWTKTGGSFPASPQDAGTGLFEYLEQRDVHRRHAKLEIQPFTVGSIVAATRTDIYSPKGPVRFVGICIEKNDEQNTTKCTFTLRNVIMDEPMEIIFYPYSPKVTEVKVLKHQVWKDRETDLTCLRDWAPEFSTVSETMEAEEYTDQPSVYELTDDQKAKLKRWFDLNFERRRVVGIPYRKREDWWPLGQYKTKWGKRALPDGYVKKHGYF